MYKVLYNYATGSSSVVNTFNTRDEVHNYLDEQRTKIYKEEKERRHDHGWLDNFMKTKFTIVEE